MVLNVVDNVNEIISEVARRVSMNGRQVWTFLHPAFNYNESQVNAKKRLSISNPVMNYTILPSYFEENHYEKDFGNFQILEIHRPISYYVQVFSSNGFVIRDLIEPQYPLSENINGFYESFFPRVITIVTSR